MQHSCEHTTYSIITRRLYLLRTQTSEIGKSSSTTYVLRTRPDRRSDKVVERRGKKKKKNSAGQRWLSLTFQRRNFFFIQGSERGRRRNARWTELRQMLAWWRAINLIFSSMNGRIGFLKVPVSLGEPHFLTPL